MSRQQVQYINTELQVGALLNLAAISAATTLDGAREQGVRIKQMKLGMSYKNKTAGEGPIIVGICSTTLSATEMAEALVADPQGIEDPPATEQGNRRMYPIWVIPAGPSDDDTTHVLEEVRYPWKEMDEGSGIKIFAFNIDGNTLTTGTEITVFGPVVQEWLRD